MKSIKLAAILLLVCAVGIGSAWADRGYGHGHRGHARFSVIIGPPWGALYYPPPPYYYRPSYYPPVVIERQPPVYIEQQVSAPPALPAPATNYWYYCAASRGYYPYVKECPSGWQRVSPTPPDQP